MLLLLKANRWTFRVRSPICLVQRWTMPHEEAELALNKVSCWLLEPRKSSKLEVDQWSLEKVEFVQSKLVFSGATRKERRRLWVFNEERHQAPYLAISLQAKLATWDIFYGILRDIAKRSHIVFPNNNLLSAYNVCRSRHQAASNNTLATLRVPLEPA